MNTMPNREDIEERRLASRLVAVIAVAVLGAAAGVAFFAVPSFAAAVEPGLGLKGAAIAAFCLTFAALIVMALAAGEGLVGEIQFMLAAFGGFFLISWLMIAWIF